MVPIQIKAQALRRWRPMAHATPVGPFAIVPDDPMSGSNGPDARGKRAWRQSDVKRAVAAAEQAGLESYRVEIAPDGTISIIVGDPSETGDPGRHGDLLGL